MRKKSIYEYDIDEIRDIKDLIHNAQTAVGQCCQDRGLTCLTCDKRLANYYLDQLKNIINGK